MPREDTLTILRTELAELLAEQNVPHSAACAITDKFVARLQQRCGGDRLLVPKIDRDKRDATILADWRAGLSPEDIIRQRGIPKTTVYRVLGRRNQRKPGGGDGGGGFGNPEWNL